MIPDHEKIETLEKVMASEEFSHSQKNQQLLKYLVEASLNDKELNETVIAVEFFGKSSNFYPLEDASIRVNISQIRKRLSNYYLTEGKEDKIQIDIPKGNYAVRFCTISKKHIDSNNNRLTKWIFPVITLFLLFIVIFLWIEYDLLEKKNEIVYKNNPIWVEILEDVRPTLVILGDYFFMYYDREGDHPRFNVRDPRINSLADFREYNKKTPEESMNLKPLSHTYLRPTAVWGFIELHPILTSMRSSFSIKQSSEVDWEDIDSHNIIFIGTFKQLYILKTFLDKLNIKISIYPNLLNLYNKNGEQVQQFESIIVSETIEYKDVGLLAKFNGPNNNKILFITGFHEGGVIHAAKAICNPDFPNALLKDYGAELQSPFNFKCVLTVKGFRRTELSSKIEYFEILSP